VIKPNNNYEIIYTRKLTPLMFLSIMLMLFADYNGLRRNEVLYDNIIKLGLPHLMLNTKEYRAFGTVKAANKYIIQNILFIVVSTVFFCIVATIIKVHYFPGPFETFITDILFVNPKEVLNSFCNARYSNLHAVFFELQLRRVIAWNFDFKIFVKVFLLFFYPMLFCFLSGLVVAVFYVFSAIEKLIMFCYYFPYVYCHALEDYDALTKVHPEIKRLFSIIYEERVTLGRKVVLLLLV